MSQQNMKCRVSELGARLCVISNTCLCLSRQQNWTDPSRLQSSVGKLNWHLIQCFFPTGCPDSPGSRFQIKSIPVCWQVVIGYTVTCLTARSKEWDVRWSLNQPWSYQYSMNWCWWTCLLVGGGEPVCVCVCEGGGAGALRKSCSIKLGCCWQQLIMVML